MSHIYKWCLHSLDLTEGGLGMALARSPLTIPLIQIPDVGTSPEPCEGSLTPIALPGIDRPQPLSLLIATPKHRSLARPRSAVEDRSRVCLLDKY